MLKNHWVYVGVVCSFVGCSGDDSGSSADGSGGFGALNFGGVLGAGATPGAGGAPVGPAGSGGTLPGAGGGFSTGGAVAAGGAGGPSAGGVTGGGGAIGTGGIDAGGAGGEGDGGAGGSPPPVCTSSAPAEFQANTTVGGGGAQFKDSPHFRIYGSAPASTVDATLNHLEAAYTCFIEEWCFRSVGLSVHSDDGPYYKMNIYGTGSLGSAAGVMRYDDRAGLSYLEVINSQMSLPRVTVHEFGHALALTEHGWVDQTRTGAWWETMANWVADTYLTSSYCEGARNQFGIAAGSTIIDLNRVIGQSYLLIVSTQNYYEAWPFLAYLTNNPDGYAGLGRMAVPDMMRNHARNNETPLHVLARIAAPITAQTILGRYWAHMAYLDIGHPAAQAAFFSRRGSLSYANLDSVGNGTYQVKSNRRPQYGGSNIIPLAGTGTISVRVENLGNGLSESNFTATLAVRAGSGALRYVDLPNGAGEATVASGEEATLVVVNTPNTLYMYDAFQTGASSPEAVGLNYRVQLAGATPAQ